MIRLLVRLLPLYLTYYLFVLVDRTFASYLPTGAVSALTYGLLIVALPASLLMMENVFITPLAESTEKGELIRQILNGIFILSVPIAFFTTAYAEEIVKAALERGAFTAVSTRMTGDALAYLALAIPALFAVPVCGRLLLILERLGHITVIGIGAVGMNALLNYIFLRAGMGIKGLALASSVAWYTYLAGYLFLLKRYGILAVTKGVAVVFSVSVAVSAIALVLSFLIPIDAGTVSGIVLRGVVFLLATAALVWKIPNEDIRYWRESVLRELFPKRS